MKILVVYYTRTGNTKTVAEHIANELNADIEEIIDMKARTGVVGSASAYLRPRATTTIEEIKHNPKDYDVVIVGGPIWWFSSVPAVNTFISDYKEQINKAAFFYSFDKDTRNRISAFPDMEEFLGKSPVATVSAESRTIKDGSYKKNFEDFIQNIKKS